MSDLLPCPFCGGEVRKEDMRIMNNWTGKRNVIISATVMHWCTTEPGQLQNCIQIKAKTVDEAIAKWNTRAR